MLRWCDATGGRRRILPRRLRAAQHPHAEIRDRDRQQRAREVEDRVRQIAERGDPERRGHVRAAAVPWDQRRCRGSRRGDGARPIGDARLPCYSRPRRRTPSKRLSHEQATHGAPSHAKHPFRLLQSHDPPELPESGRDRHCGRPPGRGPLCPDRLAAALTKAQRDKLTPDEIIAMTERGKERFRSAVDRIPAQQRAAPCTAWEPPRYGGAHAVKAIDDVKLATLHRVLLAKTSTGGEGVRVPDRLGGVGARKNVGSPLRASKRAAPC